MLAIMHGASGAWHIFRGGDASRFLAGLLVTAHWPVVFKAPFTSVSSGKLFETDQGGTVFVCDNEQVPDALAKLLYKRAVILARSSEEQKHAPNGA